MPYYPSFQIKSNLFTKGGEFQTSLDNKEYTGYYYITSDQKLFTGKNPQDPPNNELIPIGETVNDFIPEFTPASKKAIWVLHEYGYNKNFNDVQIPTSVYPTPTTKDYNLGEFQRYFLSKVNQPLFIEVDKPQYTKYNSRSKNVSYELYTPISLSWQLTGGREKTFETNLRSVERIERDLKARGFKLYFKDKFDQFYKEVGS